VLIEAMTYRYKGHGVSDKTYDKRMADELKEWVESLTRLVDPALEEQAWCALINEFRLRND